MQSAILILTVLLFCDAAITAQQPDFSTVKTDKGMMVLNSLRAQPFSFLVPGKNPAGTQNKDGSLTITTDAGIVVVYFIKTTDILDKKKSYTDVETLAAHRDLDIATQESAWKAKLIGLEKGEGFITVSNLTNRLFPTKLIPSVNWLYSAPKPGNTNRSFYQTVVLGDTVLMLGAVVPGAVNLSEVRSFFDQILGSITLLPPQQTVTAARPKPAKRPIKKK